MIGISAELWQGALVELTSVCDGGDGGRQLSEPFEGAQWADPTGVGYCIILKLLDEWAK